jgi:hypothetical protein
VSLAQARIYCIVSRCNAAPQFVMSKSPWIAIAAAESRSSLAIDRLVAGQAADNAVRTASSRSATCSKTDRRQSMRNTLLALATAATVASGAVAIPSQAQAQWWVVPAIVGSIVVGGATVAIAANSATYQPVGTVYVRPTGARCFVEQRAIDGAWRQVRVCY